MRQPAKRTTEGPYVSGFELNLFPGRVHAHSGANAYRVMRNASHQADKRSNHAAGTL